MAGVLLLHRAPTLGCLLSIFSFLLCWLNENYPLYRPFQNSGLLFPLSSFGEVAAANLYFDFSNKFVVAGGGFSHLGQWPLIAGCVLVDHENDVSYL